MKIGQNKLNGALSVTKLELQQRRRDLYVQVMEKRLTTSDQTAQAHLLTARLVLLAVQQIANANPSVVDITRLVDIITKRPF